MSIFRFLFLFTCVILLAACSSSKVRPGLVKEVSVCASGQCNSSTKKRVSREELLQGLQELLQANAGKKVPMCVSDPISKTCKKAKVCHLVFGGILPGNGCSNSLTFSGMQLDKQNSKIELETYMPLTYIWTPLKCVVAPSTLTVNSPQDISLQLQAHYCNWMLVGNMSAKLDFYVDFINFDRGEIAGYWKHSVKGTGNGSGSGYLLLTFPVPAAHSIFSDSDTY